MSDQDFPSGAFDRWKTDAPEPTEAAESCAGCGEPRMKALRCNMDEDHCWDCNGTTWRGYED